MRTSPGEILLEEFLKPRAIAALAASIDVTDETIIALIEERSAMTLELADKLGAHFGTSADFWMNLGRNHAS